MGVRALELSIWSLPPFLSMGEQEMIKPEVAVETAGIALTQVELILSILIIVLGVIQLITVAYSWTMSKRIDVQSKKLDAQLESITAAQRRSDAESDQLREKVVEIEAGQQAEEAPHGGPSSMGKRDAASMHDDWETHCFPE